MSTKGETSAPGAKKHKSLKIVTVSARVSSAPFASTIGTTESSLTRIVAPPGRCSGIVDTLT